MIETPKEAARRLAAPAIAQGFTPEALHAYRHPDGSEWYWRIRAKRPDGEKWLRPMHTNGQGYALGEPQFPNGKPLYNLDRIAADKTAEVWIVEGEKAADALAKIGMVATTSGGTQSASKADWTPLRGRPCIVWRDNDGPGQQYAEEVVTIIKALGCQFTVIDVDKLGLPQKGDAADWTAAHPAATPTDLDRLPWLESFNGLVSGSTWPIAKEIRAELPAVEAFDASAMLPVALQGWVMDEAHRMPCAPDLIAAPAVVALGALIGARCAIKPKARDDWAVVPNLWGGVVALPSAKKSPAISVAMRPLDRLAAAAAAAHESERTQHQAEALVHKARREACEEALKGAAKSKAPQVEIDCLVVELTRLEQAAPPAPTPRRFKTNDSTVEKLGELLRDNPRGLLIHRDELVGLLASWDREGHESDRAFFLEAWNGNQSYNTDRIARGSILIPNLCLSVFGGIQPDKLTSYLEQTAHSLTNDGMLQRFQVMVYPDAGSWEWRDRLPDRAAREQADQAFNTLADFDPLTFGASPPDDFSKLPTFRFSPEAQGVFIEWSTELHQKRLAADDHPLVTQHLTKFDKLFPALALIFHLVECAATHAAGPVSRAAALMAAGWCEYLESHARRCYGLLMDDGLRSAQALAARVRKGQLADGFTARDVTRNQWRYLTTSEAARAALTWLEDEGWLRSVMDPPQPGRRTTRYQINPALRKEAGNV